MSFFIFPQGARWNDGADALEFSIGIGEYEGTMQVAYWRRLVGTRRG